MSSKITTPVATSESHPDPSAARPSAEEAALGIVRNFEETYSVGGRTYTSLVDAMAEARILRGAMESSGHIPPTDVAIRQLTSAPERDEYLGD